MKTNKITICAIFAVFIVALSAPVYANYQSIYQSSSYKTQTATNWISTIRNMEASGQVMGLTETYNTTTLESTSGSNNIDVHMMKNTEFGAVAILSASQEYGKQGEGVARYVTGSKATGLKTTTGNVYGVYFEKGTAEFTASGGAFPSGLSATSKYINRYTSNTDRKAGDAILAWHGSTGVNPYSTSVAYATCRASSGSGLFYTASNSSGYTSRAAVVCGSGF